jgi:hypothetical protein
MSLRLGFILPLSVQQRLKKLSNNLKKGLGFQFASSTLQIKGAV